MKNLKGFYTMLLSGCLIVSGSFALADIKAPDELSQGLVNLAEPLHRALAAEANKDPRIAAQVAAYRASAKQIIQDARLKDAERQLQLRELSRRFEPVYKVMFQRAGINEPHYKAQGEQHIKRMAARQNRRYVARYLGYLGWYWKLLPQPPRDLKPATKEVTLTVPFPFEQSDDNGGGDNTVDKNDGKYQAKAVVPFAGGHDNSAGLAHFFKVDDNYRDIGVSAALPETEWHLTAFSDVLGVFGANAKSRIEIFSNNQIVCSEEVEHGNVLAPVLYIADQSGLDNIVTTCQINDPVRNDEIVIRATSVAGAWGGGLGISSSRVKATPRDLRLLLNF